jgi:hypothetical protein
MCKFIINNDKEFLCKLCEVFTRDIVLFLIKKTLYIIANEYSDLSLKDKAITYYQCADLIQVPCVSKKNQSIVFDCKKLEFILEQYNPKDIICFMFKILRN